MAWLSGYNKRIKLTILYSNVTSNLTHFAVRVRLTSSHGDCVFDELTSDANRFKIAFTAADETTQLYGDIESWDDANETAVIWVSKSGWTLSSSAHNYIYLYYDSSHADNTTYISDAGGTAAQSAWDTDTVLACHMANDPNGDAADAVKDSTSRNHDLTPNGSMTTADLVAGAAGGLAIELDGGNDFLSTGNHTDINIGNGAFTVEFLVSLSTLPGAGVNVNLLSLGTPGDSDLSYEIDIYNDSGSYLLRLVWSTDGTWQGSTSYKTISLTAGVFTHLAITRSGASVTFYQDGSSLGTNSIGAGVTFYNNDSDDLIVGAANGGTAERINAKIDEFFFADACRSSDYIADNKKNCFDTLISTYGSEETSTTLATADPVVVEITMHDAIAYMPDLAEPATVGVEITVNDAAVEEIALADAIGITISVPSVSACDVDMGIERSRVIFTLTGDADGVDDVEIPISSLSARLRDGEPTYLQVVIPGDDYAAEIADRSNGEMVVEIDYYNDAGSLYRSEAVRVDLETIDTQTGTRNTSIVLVGHKTTSYPAKTVTMENVAYQRNYGGEYRLRSPVIDFFVRPGDTIQYGVIEFTAASITITINETQQSMEVAA